MTNKVSLKIAIASGKGGTGKTLLSTNLAAYLSETGNTLLADLDVEEPNSALFIKGEKIRESTQYKMIPQWDEPRCTLCGECTDNCKFHAVVQMGKFIAVFKELCHSCYACSELCPTQALPMQAQPMGQTVEYALGQLHLVESRLNIGEEQAVPLIHKTQKLVAEHYGHIGLHLFDCPPGTSCPTVAATESADFIVLVSEPTPFGLHDLKLAVETMRQLQKPFGVVINRFGIGNDEVENFCRAEGIHIISKIPFHEDIARLYSQGKLAYNAVPALKESLAKLHGYIGNLTSETTNGNRQ